MKTCIKVLLVVLLVSASAAICLAGETATLRNGFTIHYERRETIGDTTRLYLSSAADSFVDVPSNDIIEVEADKALPPAAMPQPKARETEHPIRLDEALSAASQKNNISPELLRSVIRVESSFNPNARSAKGAQGLMQLMPATAAKMGVRNVFDPAQNMDGGARYLRELLGRYDNNLTFALAAYNAGPQRVEKYHGIPPFPETISYVSRVLKNLDEERVASWKQPLTTASLRAPQRESHAPNLDAIREFQNAIASSGKDTPDVDNTDTGDAN